LFALQLWLNPLKIAIGTDNEIITQRDIEALFPNGEVIINLGAQLLELLSDRMDNWDPYQKIGDVFLKLVRIDSRGITKVFVLTLSTFFLREPFSRCM
jgi:hypothetical protein